MSQTIVQPAPLLGSVRPSDAAALLDMLRAQHRRVLGIVGGLTDEEMRRPVLPSGWSCIGMVHHLMLGARFWLQDVMTGTRSEWMDDDDFHVPATTPVAALLAEYAAETQRVAALVMDLALGTPPAWWPDGLWGDWRLDSLAEVLMHLLVETSCHAGHLDAARELLDGRIWDYASGGLAPPPAG